MQRQNRWAFKEWAVVCEALATGRQTILLRKGGIHEGPAGFQVEHPEFWLFATRFHQNAEELSDDGRLLLGRFAAPDNGSVLLPAYARVEEVFRLSSERQLPALEGLHVLSERTVAERFHYRAQGLFALLTRVFVPPQPVALPDSPHFAGCRTWVALPTELPTEGLQPALSDNTFQRAAQQIRERLRTSAFA